jgi:hypothetical protein
MRTCGIGLIVMVAAAPFTSLADDAPSWGPAVGGVRLAIGLGPASSEPAFRVLLQNTSSTGQNVLVGAQRGNSPVYNLQFTAKAPDGKECRLFDVKALVDPMAGLASPVVIHLDPGGTHEITYPLKELLCIEGRREITLDTLLKRRYSVRASLEVDAKGAKWSGLPHPWIGRVMSGELSERK